MDIKNRINSLSRLGKILLSVGNKKEWKDFNLGITKEEYNNIVELTKKAKHHNGWFTEKEVLYAFDSWGKLLTKENIQQWIDRYNIQKEINKNIAIIMAGNIPLVGFHDLISVYLLGGKIQAKLSSDDNILIPELVKILSLFDIKAKENIKFTSSKLERFDAVIATGSNNTARYFKSYFDKYPNIIRKNRTSIAIIEGNETHEDLTKLANDVFTYYGLGCRNITKIFIPQNYDLNNIFKAFFNHKYVLDNNKYANNYDYHKAVYLMEQHKLIENGFILLKEDNDMHSPIGMLFYEYYNDIQEVEKYIKEKSSKIQCVVGNNKTPFGESQKPKLWEYADNIDIVKFLINI